MGGGPQPCGSATLGSKPWPAPSAVSLLAVTGITNKSLRALMTGLLGQPYGMNRASYDLTRLRRNGLITRVEAATSTGSPTTASPSPSSTPRSTTGSCGH